MTGHERVLSRALDADYMTALFQRELADLLSASIRPVSCTLRHAAGSKSARTRRLEVVYRLTLRSRGGRQWEQAVVGVLPVTRDFLNPELLARCRAARGHPAAGPFQELSTYVDHLEMALVVLPIDPGLPGLAALTGDEAAGVLSPYLGSNGHGARIEDVRWTLGRYKPFRRCTLRLSATTAHPDGARRERRLEALIYADDRGERHHANLRAVWAVARKRLTVPEPLGYDPAYHMLVVNGDLPARDDDWVDVVRFGNHRPLEAHLARLAPCMKIVAGALIELQGSGLEPMPERTFRGELARMHRHVGRLRGRYQDLAPPAEALLERLAAEAVDGDRLVPAHGGFRHRVMVGDERGLTITDWGGLCLAPPALDAATFLAALRHAAHRSRTAPLLAGAAEAFRGEFLAQCRAVGARELAVYEALALVVGALRTARRSTRCDTTAHHVRRLLADASSLLDG